MIRLGQKLRDKVTGFEGIATARCEYLNGCVQYCVLPPVDEKGERRDGIYIDQQQLEVVGDGVTVAQSFTGGPTPAGTPTSYRG
jgi:hypothetical protein